MRLVEFLCVGGLEVANSARVTHYARNIGLPGATFSADCPCDAIDTGFDTPADDPAPWYEPTRPESEQFYGFYAHSISLEPVMSRNVTPGRHGSYLSPLSMKGRQVQVIGSMVASSPSGMAYGESWLAEVLRGSACADGCFADDVTILRACPEDGYESDAFRTLVGAACIDGPVFVGVDQLPECYIQQAAFNIVSAKPYLYHPTTTCLDEYALSEGGDPGTCSLTTPEWMGEGVFVIDITNMDTVATTDITITGRISPDGDCPVTGDALSIPPSFVYTIPSLEPSSRLVIDGMRRQALYYDPSAKVATSALPYLEWEGAFPWPEVGACTTMCVEVTGGAGGDSVLTVQTALREL